MTLFTGCLLKIIELTIHYKNMFFPSSFTKLDLSLCFLSNLVDNSHSAGCCCQVFSGTYQLNSRALSEDFSNSLVFWDKSTQGLV